MNLWLQNTDQTRHKQPYLYFVIYWLQISRWRGATVEIHILVTYHPFSHFAYTKFSRIYNKFRLVIMTFIISYGFQYFSGVDQVGNSLISYNKVSLITQVWTKLGHQEKLPSAKDPLKELGMWRVKRYKKKNERWC